MYLVCHKHALYDELLDKESKGRVDDKTYGLLQVPSQWTILHASEVLSVSSSKRCIVYTRICVLRFLWKDIFLLYVYLQNGKNNEEKEKKEKDSN